MLTRFWSYMPVFGDLSTRNKTLYPQLEAKAIHSNSTLLSYAETACRRILPASVFEKLIILDTLVADSIDGLAVIEGPLCSSSQGARFKDLRACGCSADLAKAIIARSSLSSDCVEFPLTGPKLVFFDDLYDACQAQVAHIVRGGSAGAAPAQPIPDDLIRADMAKTGVAVAPDDASSSSVLSRLMLCLQRDGIHDVQ